MAEYVTLMGAEQVQSAGVRMSSAAEEMRHAAASIEDSLTRHQRFLDDDDGVALCRDCLFDWACAQDISEEVADWDEKHPSDRDASENPFGYSRKKPPEPRR